jgi:hypothetical protein
MHASHPHSLHRYSSTPDPHDMHHTPDSCCWRHPPILTGDTRWREVKNSRQSTSAQQNRVQHPSPQRHRHPAPKGLSRLCVTHHHRHYSLGAKGVARDKRSKSGGWHSRVHSWMALRAASPAFVMMASWPMAMIFCCRGYVNQGGGSGRGAPSTWLLLLLPLSGCLLRRSGPARPRRRLQLLLVLLVAAPQAMQPPDADSCVQTSMVTGCAPAIAVLPALGSAQQLSKDGAAVAASQVTQCCWLQDGIHTEA